MLDHILHITVALLGSAVLVSLLAARLRLPALVGLLLTGVVIGPSGLGWVAEAEEVEAFAEIGVALLLFAIGLELSLTKLLQLRRAFLLGGGIQSMLTIALVALGARVFGLAWGNAVFVGSVVALSSTAIVLRLLDQRGETGTPHGNVTLGILLFQDFLIVPLIVITPVLGGAVPLSLLDLGLRFGGALLVVILVVISARRLMPKLLELLARTRTRETFLLGGLAICLALSWLTHALGFSLALGAFLAGLVISESEYSHQVFADVAPFRDLFSSIFFMSVGMLVDANFVAHNLAFVLAIAFGAMLLKALVAALATAVVGFPLRTRILVGLGLCQVGEFSFVLLEVGHSYSLLSEDRHQALLAATALTMVITPLLFRLGPWLVDKITPTGDAPVDRPKELQDHVLILGYGLSGQLVAKVLKDSHLPYCLVELDPDRIRQARKAEEPIHFGDATRPDILLHAGIERARMVVFTLSDAAALNAAVRLAKQLAPKAELLVRTRRVHEIDNLHRQGADHVVAEEFETAIEIFTRVLRRFHIPGNIIRAQTRVLRGEHYAMLRTKSVTGDVSNAVLDALSAGTSDIYRIGSDHPVIGETLRDLDLRRQTGATVLAIVRGEHSEANPAADERLEAGDCLVLVGAHRELDDAFALLDTGRGSA